MKKVDDSDVLELTDKQEETPETIDEAIKRREENVEENKTEAKEVKKENKEQKYEESKEHKEFQEKRKKRIRTAIIITIIIILLLLLRSCSNSNTLPIGDNKPTQEVEIDDSPFVEKENTTTEAKQVSFYALKDFTVTKAYPYVTLGNPDVNKDKYYLIYSFYLEGEDEPFYQSKYIKAGDEGKISANIGELLDSGVYNVYATVSAHRVDDVSYTCNGGDAHIKVTVE